MTAPAMESPVTRYEVRDAAGTLVATKVRRDYIRPDGTPDKECHWEPSGLRVADLPLYGIHDLTSTDRVVYVVEGEKDRDALAAVGLPAVGTVTGSSGTPSPAVLAELSGLELRLWPDHDTVGRDHMRRIAAACERIGGIAVSWLDPADTPDWPDPPKGGGAADYLATRTAADVRDLPVRTIWLDPDRAERPDLRIVQVGETTDARWEWLHDVIAPDTEAPLALEPFILDEGPTILFGDGDTGKSALALVLAASIASGRELIRGVAPRVTGPVMWIDYEAQRKTTRRRQRRIGAEGGILYVPGLRPLHEDVDTLHAIAEREGVVLAVVDSIVLAMGGGMSPNDAVTPTAYANAINRIAPRSLGLGHVPKDKDDGGMKPFGSTYWHNVARLTWNARRDANHEGHVVALRCRKHNDGERFGPMEYTFDWSDDRLVVTPDKVGRLAEIVDALAGGPMTVGQLATRTGTTEGTIRVELNRHRERFASEPGPEGATWRLAK